MKRTGDKRIVGDGIAEADQARTATRVLPCRQASRLLEHLRQAQYGIGINTGLRGAAIHRGADMPGEARASGKASKYAASPRVMPHWTSAENPAR